MIIAVCLYVTVLVDGFVAIYACHQRPYGVKNTWPSLWKQLNYRLPSLPIAKVK